MENLHTLPISMESDALATLKSDMDTLITQTISSMKAWNNKEGVINVKLTIKLNEDLADDGKGGMRPVVVPRFEHKVAAVLQAKAERERGCAYCNESKHLYHEAGPTTRMDSYMCVCDDQLEVELWQSGNSGCLAKINFCPMCGNALPSKYKPEQPKIEWDAFIEAQIQKAVENHRNNNGEDDNHGA